MDEVHYLADRFRGAVWEEVIIHLPESVALVSLSATVSNAEEFGDWLVTVRGDTSVVVDEHRPVPLWQHMLVGQPAVRPVRAATRAPTASCRSTPSWCGSPARLRPPAPRDRARGDRAAARPRRADAPARAGCRPPSRSTCVDRLDRDGLLPAITFIFSRAGCDAAVAAVPARRAAADHRRRARRDPPGSSRRAPATCRRRTCGVLGYCEWLDGAGARARRAPRRAAADVQGDRRGAVRPRPGQGGLRHRDPGARHQHAGPLRRAGAAGQVERRGARRRHAGGVHPAHRPGRPPRHRRRGPRGRGLAARGRPAAGRRARLDPHLPAALVLPARLQHGGQPGRPLRPAPRARELLEHVVRAVPGRPVGGRAGPAGRAQREEALAGYAGSMRCHLGDFAEYAALRRRSADREKELRRQGTAQRRDAADGRAGGAAARRRHRGAGRAAGRAGRRARPRGARRRRPAPAGAHRGPLGRAALVRRTSRRRSRRWAGCGSRQLQPPRARSAPRPRVDAAQHRHRRPDEPAARPLGQGAHRTTTRSSPRCAGRSAQHPCHGCADREDHARWAERYPRLQRETEQLRQKVRATTHTLARQFDRICALLAELGYLAAATTRARP